MLAEPLHSLRGSETTRKASSNGMEPPHIWVSSQREKSVDYSLFIPVTAPAGKWSPWKMCVGDNTALANEPRAGMMLIAIVQSLVVSSLLANF